MNFRLDQASLAEALAELDRRCWLFDQLPIDPQHADWLRKRAWIRTIHGTTRIEGNTASDLEVEALLAGEAEGELKITKKEGREIIGTRESLSLVDRLAQDGVDPDEGVIREVHKLVLWKQSPLLTPGVYRKGENRVEGPNGRLIFHTPPSGDVDDLMRDFGVWLRTGAEAYPAPIAAALAHLEFVAIHPFNDGNGRTARALARLILTRHGYALDRLVSIDAQLDIDRRSYFAALRRSLGQAYRPGYDATPFVDYMLTSITKSTDYVLARIRGLGQLMVEVRRAISDRSVPPGMIDGLAFAWINRHIRASDYMSITGRNPQATTRDFQAAVETQWLVPTGEKKGRYYVLGPRLLAVPSEGEIPASSSSADAEV
jgi:Fic family protein